MTKMSSHIVLKVTLKSLKNTHALAENEEADCSTS